MSEMHGKTQVDIKKLSNEVLIMLTLTRVLVLLGDKTNARCAQELMRRVKRHYKAVENSPDTL